MCTHVLAFRKSKYFEISFALNLGRCPGQRVLGWFCSDIARWDRDGTGSPHQDVSGSITKKTEEGFPLKIYFILVFINSFYFSNISNNVYRFKIIFVSL